MRKILALVLCLILCVSTLAACGDGEPVDTTKSATPGTTNSPDNETTKPTDETTTPSDETTTPSDETTQGTESDDSTTGTSGGPESPANDLYDVKEPAEDKLAIDNIGAVNAGSVASDYTTFSSTGISSLSEITDLNGSYYLKGDISANETTVLGKFNGVLDGCGHTITTTVAIFEKLGGIVRNLNIAGDISYAVEPQSSLALTLINGAAIVNVKSTADIKVGDSAETGVYAAGFAVTGSGSVLFYNCEYAGTIINSLTGVSGNDRRVGGFVAKFGGLFSESGEESDDADEISELKIVNCTFNGTVSGSSHIGGFIGEISPNTDASFYGVAVKGTIKGTFEGAAGGIMGYTGGTASSMVDFYNCYNEAAISVDEKSGQKANAGGFAGYLNNSGGASMVTFTYCTNKADISATQHIGGMVGKCNNYVTFEECVNYGDLTAYEITPDVPSKTDNFVGGLVGYTNGSSFQNEIEKCVNFGDITGNTQRVRMGGLVGHNESGNSGFKIVDSMNFGNITSNYKSQNVNDADYRLAGIVAGGYGHYIIKNCVNFGDVTGYFHKSVQPVGGILGMGHNQAGRGDILENCVNYGNVSSLADPIDGVYGGTQCAGLVGCLYGGGEFSIKGCVNAGIINGFGITAALVYQHNANLSPDSVFDNNFYLENCYAETRIDGTQYGVFGIDNTKLHEEISAKATAFAKAQLTDTTSEGLAAKINTALGSDVYVVTEVTLANGLPFKCIMPKTLVSE